MNDFNTVVKNPFSEKGDYCVDIVYTDSAYFIGRTPANSYVYGFIRDGIYYAISERVGKSLEILELFKKIVESKDFYGAIRMYEQYDKWLQKIKYDANKGE